MRRRVCAALVCISVAMIGGVACGGGSSGSKKPVQASVNFRGKKNVTVSAENNLFVPADIYVDAGTKVTWVNNDTTAHDIAKASPAIDFDGKFGASLAEFGPNKRYSFTFNKPGDLYFYTCTIHTGMNGRVHVFAKSSPTTPTS